MLTIDARQIRSGLFQEFLRLRLCVLDPGADLDLMKEKFAKLLLGEDMSGTGKGVSSALALSNAITNLAGKHSFFPPLIKKMVLLQGPTTCINLLHYGKICSFHIRGAAPPRAHVGRSEGAVEQGDRLAPVRHRPHRRVRSVTTSIRGRDQHGGQPAMRSRCYAAIDLLPAILHSEIAPALISSLSPTR